MNILNLLIGILSAFLILSCTSVKENNLVHKPSTEKILLKIAKKTYYKGELELRTSSIFENNQTKIDSFYNSDNQLTYYSEWFYNSDGLLSGIKGYFSSGELSYESVVSYDSLNRIIQEDKLEENEPYETVKYIYNSDNTITSITIFNGNKSSKTFYTNSSGIIYKEIDGENITEVTYDSNNNPIQKIDPYYVTTTYTYHETILKPKILLALSKNIFGTAPNNAFLFSNSLNDQASSYGNKLLIKEESESGISTTEHEFDTDGYLIKSTIFYNEFISSESNYIYK